MMKIPDFMNRDDYLQNPIMRRFLKNHDLDFVENRADYITAIEAQLQKYSIEQERLERRAAYFAENADT